MKKNYLLLLWMLFMASYLSAQTTETFETSTVGATSFTSGSKTFNLSSNFIGFTVAQIQYAGYNQSDRFIQVTDLGGGLPGTYGQTGTISTTGSFKLNNLWVYLTGDSANQNPNQTLNAQPGTVTFRGLLGGTLKFTVTKTYASGAANPTPAAAGFNYIDFATEGGTNNTNTLIDQLEIQLSTNYDYFAIDNFAWTANTSPTITTSGTLTNFTTCAGTVSSEKSFTASGSSLTGNITVTAPTGYELSTVSGGTFTGTLTLTQSGGSVANTTIYVRTTSGATGNPAGNISLTSASATGVAVAVTSTINPLPTITTQPSASTINAGANTTFSVAASNATGYQWQVNTGSGFVNITNGGVYSGATTSILTITGATAGMNGYSYRVTVSGSCPSATSNAVSLTVNSNPVVTGNPPNRTLCPGGNTTFPVTATGATSYQWQVNTGSGFADVTNGGIYSNATTSTLTLTGVTVGMSGYQYRCVVTNASGSTNSNSATLTVPNIVVTTTAQTNVSCNGGTNGSATVTATGGFAPYTYSWSPSGGTGATATGLAPGTYTVTVTDNITCTKNHTVIITQPTATVSGTTVVTNIACNSGNSGAINLTPTGGTGPYTFNWGGGITTEDRTGLVAGTYSVTITDNNGCTGTVSGITVTQPTAIASSVSAQTNVPCSGGATGSATVSATGGAGSYTYSWAPSGGTAATATGLSAGTYTVTITDANSCIKTQTVTIIQAPAPSGTASFTNVSCNGGNNGTAHVAASGGTSPYSYLWSNGATTATAVALSAGTYSVTITDANACTGNVSGIVITQPTLLVASQGTINNVSCNGGSNGSATVLATGGTGSKTYSWSPSGGTAATASGLVAGTYTVRVTDANFCQTTQSFTITQPSPFSITTSQTDVLCNGAGTGSASVTVNGGTGAYTYSWSPTGGTAATATGLTAGTYVVTITDANSCQTTRTFTIVQPSALVATPQSMTNIGCRGDATGSATVNVTGGTGAYTYSWAPSGGTAATASGLVAGTYTVTVKDANLCQTTQSFTITQPAAILSASTASTGVSCFGGSNGTASVTVSGGTPGYTYVWAPLGGNSSSISGRPAGNYTCTITDVNGCTLVKNITISTPAAFSATTSKTDVSCNGGTNGTATVTPSGATAPYSYSWSPTGGTGATATGLSAGTYVVTVQDANTCVYMASVTIDQPSAISVTPSHTNVLCSGGATGTATVAVTGGTPGYTYVWSPSGGTASTATGLTAGNYSVLITDAKGCTFTQNFSITQPTALAASTAHINATCVSPGQASVTPSGGTSPYTYLWSNGATTQTVTGLVAGTYSVTITDGNGCTLVKNFTITTTNTLVATTSQTDVLCKGAATGTATVVPSGAPGPFTYVWAPSGGTAATATGLIAGNYTVTITSSNGCSTVKSFTITEPATAIIATAGPQTNISCSGGSNGSATVTVTGGTGAYTYSWSPSGGTAATASGLAAGTYTVTVKDANLCQTTQSFTITQPAAITSTVSAQTNVSCNGGTNASATVTPTGGTGAYTYLWSPSGGTAATASGLAAGTYTVTIKDANLCQATQTVIITQPAILAATTTKTDVSCFNGSNGTATVNPTGGTTAYTYSWAPSGGTAATATGLTAGTYTVTVTDSKGCTTTATAIIAQPASALATTAGTQLNLVCNGGATGSATVNVTGGTGTYTYAWAPSGGTAATATGLAAGTYTVTVTDANGCTATRQFTITGPTAITATSIQTNILCNGGSNGSATVTPTGGSGTGYTYSWAPTGGTAATATGLPAGVYTVTITDSAGCTGTKIVTITQPGVLVANATSTNINCNGSATGTATITTLGGTAPFSYVWTPAVSTTATATGLNVGNYSVAVTDANGCTASTAFTITQRPALVVTQSHTNVTCNGLSNGTASVVATGGSPEYFYQWAPTGGTASSATGLAAGTYTVTVTDVAGCVNIQTITITQPNALAVAVNQTDILCGGTATGQIAVNVTGGSGVYTYAWTPNVSTTATAANLTAGNYSVTITDSNGCSTLRNFTLTQPVALVNTVTKTDVTCNGTPTGTALVVTTGGAAPYSYQWLPAGGTAATATGLYAGTYTVAVTDANGCTKVETVIIAQPQGVNITTQPQTANITVTASATFTTVAGNVTTYQWQESADGTTWTDITDGGASPVYSGAATSTLTVSNVPVSYDGYLYRVQFSQGADCFTLSNAVALNVNNVLVAVADNFSNTTILEGTGGIAGDVTANDLYNNQPLNDTDVTITVIDTGGLAGVTIDANGNINVPAATPDGTYYVVYSICDNINNANCSNATVTIVVSAVSGVVDFANASISIFPNPASTEVFVKIPDYSSYTNLKASLYDLNGRIVKEGSITNDNFSMDVTGLESAIYILNVTSDSGVITKRIAVTKKF